MRRPTRDDQERAQRLADFADSLVVRHRRGDPTQGDAELDALSDLASELSAIRITAQQGSQERVLRQMLDRAAERQARRFGFAMTGMFPAWVHPAAALAAAAVAMILTLALTGSRTASAAAILTKSDLAISRLVTPGKVLFRRWRIVDRIRDRAGAPERVVERYTLEWIDGSDIRHATGKSTTSEGQLYLAYANVLDHGRYVPRVYYAPGFADEPRGLVSIVPSREEFEAAATRFTGSEREVVERFLARGYIYEPIVSERRFNDAMLQPVTGREPLPQVVLSVDDASAIGGVAVYRVRSIEAVRLPFRWSSAGPPRMWLERQETTRYIAKDSYLTIRAEEDVDSETGRRVRTTRELVETKTIDAASGEDPFAIPVPPGVPTRRQSPFDHLSQITRVLQRAPAFLAHH